MINSGVKKIGGNTGIFGGNVNWIFIYKGDGFFSVNMCLLTLNIRSSMY